MLNLVKIELRGFKSFADKVEIPFREGVTAIIGPNGCGKSNVSDAIRWTLGEKSAKQLRGKSMQDVIFAGTEKRRSMSYCEVSLTFNNENQHIFPTLPFDEVVITRKLDRSGMSEYFLNNNHTRLRDIIALFHDTGIGKEGYSIIGQGRVDEIMSAKPDERRRIFEEAAGISKFRAERIEAERKLEKTALNLQTTNEVIAEIEKQIGPLRKQAEMAKRYNDLKEQLKHQEVNLYIYNYENNQAIKQKIYDRIAGYDKTLKLKDMEYNECVRRYDACITESSGIDRVFEDHNAELLSLKVGEAKSEGEAIALKERIANIQSQIVRLNEELTSVDNRLIVSEQTIKNTTAKKEEEFAAYLHTCKAYEDVNSKYSQLTDTLAGQESDLEARNLEYVRAIEELGALKSNISGFQAEKTINEERAKSIKQLLSQKKEKLDEELTNLSIFDGKVKTARDRMRQVATEYNECMTEKAEAQEAVKAFAEDISSLNGKLSANEERVRTFQAIKDQYSAYQNAVANLMKDSKHDPVLSSKIMGVLAEVISVPSEFEAAIEYALGGAMQNVLVENEGDASDLIAYLKQKNYGRVTFRPLTSCRPHELTGESVGVLKEPGCYGLASKLVKYDPKFDGFIQTLLGSTVVVNNIDNAIRIFRKYNQAFKIVTLDGEIFSRGGEITGGSRRNQTQGLLSQEKQIESARANLEKIKNNIAQIMSLREEKENDVVACEEKLELLNKEISELRIEIGVNEDKAKQALQITETLQTEINQGAEEYELVIASIKDITDKLNSIDALEKITAEKKEEYTTLLADTKSENTKQKTEREELAQRVMDLRIKMTTRKSALDGYDQELFRLSREKESLEEEKLDTIAQLKIEQSKLDNIASAPEKSSFSKEDEARIRILEKEIADLSERKRTISDEIKALDAQKTDIFNERNELTAKKTRDEGMLDNVDIEMRQQQTHILEEYDLTYASAVEFKDPEFKSYGALTVISD